MSPASVDIRCSLHHKMLIAALIVLTQDLSSRGGVQAWTYNYSISINREWENARQWCQEHFTDIVPIHSQEENDFINDLLPFHPKYYWIGIHKVNKVWTWVDNNKKVPEEVQNWAPREPDNYKGQDCVEIYIRNSNMGKWNNERCTRKKGAVCYSLSCSQDSCSVHADCVETVGNFICQCHPGFHGPRCEEAIECNPLPDSVQGSHHCLDPYGSNRFNSSCYFNCDLGFRLVGTPQLLCQADGHWDHAIPLCQAEQCRALNHTTISGGSMNCRHPVASYSYKSTCEVRCNEGYELNGEDQIRCDHNGQWTANVPTCSIKNCSSIFFPVTGNMTCVDTVKPFSFGSQCNFACQEGYNLMGDDKLTCLASGQWSKPTPSCAVVQCNSLEAPPHASVQCQDPLGAHSYGSICTVQCDDGFELIGTNMTKCSSEGNWSHALPICQAKRCPTLNAPSHGSLNCSAPHGEFGFGSQCTSTCDEGFLLNGAANTECMSDGTWSTNMPLCLAKRCPTLDAPSHGSFNCSDPHGEFSFGSRCMSTCDEGFLLSGAANTECNSEGRWNENMPHCLAKRCPTLDAPSHGSLNCSDPHGEFSFGSQCTSTCEEGFLLNGAANTECMSDGTWREDMPRCLAKRCPTLDAPSHGSFNCSDPHGEFSFGSQCTSACDEGFLLNGAAQTQCTSLGTWSANMPHCLAKRCPTLDAPSHGSFNCSDPHGEFSFGSRCTSTCDEGFLLSGAANTECNSMGRWNENMPHCLAKRCPTLDAPSHGSLNCSDPHGEFSFGSQCTSACDEGFLLNGAAQTQCTSLGTWSANMPHCLAKRCPTLDAPSHGSFNCSDPHGEFSFGSRCTSTCDEGFLLSGADDTECNSMGRWNENMPHCLARSCPLLDAAPQHGRMNCSHPYSNFSYNSHCDFECNEGFWLKGSPSITCKNSGHWSEDVPTCRIFQCEAIPAMEPSSPLSMNCSHPLGNNSFGSQCLFTCKGGFSLNGTETLFCSSTGIWNDSLPSCTRDAPVGAAMFLNSGIGVASLVIPLALALIGATLLILMRFRKKDKPIMSELSTSEENENPAFEF